MNFLSRAFSRESGGRLRKLTFLRLVVATLVVGAAIILVQLSGTSRSMVPLYALLGVIYASTAAIDLAERAGAPWRALLWTQIALDCAVLTTILQFSGGSASQFAILYLLPILVGGIYFETAGGLATAALATTAYIVYNFLEFGGHLRPAVEGPVPLVGYDDNPLLRGYLYMTVFVVAGVLTGALAGYVRRKQEDLSSKEAELKRVRYNTDNIIRNVSSGLIVTNMSGQIVVANPSAVKILGLRPAEELRCMLIEDVVPHMPAFIQEIESVLTTGAPRRRHEIEVRRKDGTVLPLGVSISVLPGESGEKRGVVAIFQDLTEVHLMREKVRHADRMAAVGELSTAIAHEIRAPLASICGSIEMLAGELEVSGDNRKLMDLIVRESDRLDRIITDFLEFARLRKPEPEAIDVERSLNDVLLLIRHSTDLNRDVRMRVECATPHPLMYADEEQVRQVFFNLIINACEAMSDGGTLAIRIERQPVELREGAGAVESLGIDFENDGPAIPEEVRPHIFEPFYTTKEGGTGLGLAIVSRIVESHGGLIRVTSAEGSGTVFSVIFPVQGAGIPERGEALREEFISF